MKTFQKENNILINSFLKHTFLKGWTKGLENFETVELQIGTQCDLKCKYCYYTNYGKSLYPDSIQNPALILNNLEKVLNWFVENDFSPPRIELFGGEPFSSEIGFKCLKLILNKFKSKKNKPKRIVIPTNYTFLLSKEKTEKVEILLKYSRKIKIPIILSASFDGKYCENNRPFKIYKGNRNNQYYDKCFAFNKKWNFGFHPMIYSELIENWKENFLWFQKNFKKFKIPFDGIYLLEVRNTEWTKKQTKEFIDFIEFLIEWTYNIYFKKNTEYFLNFLFKSGYNILKGSLTTCGRGLGCSIQSTLQIRLGDLTIVPCHRTSYSPFILGKFIVKDNKIKEIESKNPELMIGEIAFDSKNAPICEACPLKYLCLTGCLGSQFETTGDLFSPIPTVCQLEHAKIYAMIKAYKKLGLYNKIYSRVNKDKKISLNILEKLIYEK